MKIFCPARIIKTMNIKSIHPCKIEGITETGEEKTILFGLTGTGYFDIPERRHPGVYNPGGRFQGQYEIYKALRCGCGCQSGHNRKPQKIYEK